MFLLSVKEKNLALKYNVKNTHSIGLLMKEIRIEISIVFANKIYPEK